MNDLISVITLDIPEIQKPEDGFLEIARLSHNENVNSRIYSYYLNQTKNPDISIVFLNALLKLINEKTDKDLIFDDFKVETEVRTKTGKRIDICITDEVNKSVIIIENKIYHQINNKLIEYWNHIKIDTKNKVGILLTLEKAKIPKSVENEFINITHMEWINEIKSIGLPSAIPIKNYIYINDFIQTIENLSTNEIMNESVEFYFEHSKKINKAIKTADEAYAFIDKQIEVLASMLNLETYGKSKTWRNIWNRENDHRTFYTIIFGDILNGEKNITVIIEVEKDDIKRIPELKELLKENPQYLRLDKDGQSNKSYVHFLKKTYKVDIDDIKNLAEFTFNKIEKDFKSVMSIIINTLYSEK